MLLLDTFLNEELRPNLMWFIGVFRGCKGGGYISAATFEVIIGMNKLGK
ncbi:hypothetical protein PS662_06016 [Pseudomonas fluorescens]|uniref:Uncharacterized protein n=1 Tax=Pseudomonas fluorescens TaxID=294 RepID=A0A5E6Y139_PSEFL|nr:hypothetical protein PS662_06016 [Pseudomonas fluorescens]